MFILKHIKEKELNHILLLRATLPSFLHLYVINAFSM